MIGLPMLMTMHVVDEKLNENIQGNKRFIMTYCFANPEGPELAKNGCQSHQIGLQVTNLVAENDANLPLSPRFRQVLIESPL
ncbi:hypothetical protein TNCV_3691941 [Trichonephila clavipes]|nr:hypothetical protein TNCV_3691941 [Trichonephila clavipes]